MAQFRASRASVERQIGRRLRKRIVVKFFSLVRRSGRDGLPFLGLIKKRWLGRELPTVFLDFVADASAGRVRADAKSGMKRYSSVNSRQWREQFGWMLTANRKPLAFPDMQSVHL